MINWPTPPSGSTNEASFMRRLVDCCKKSVPKAGPGLRSMETPNGVIFVIDQGRGFVTASIDELYQITQLKNDEYFKAKRLDNLGNPTGEEIDVAKSLTGRQPDSEEIDGFTISYTYSDDNNRTADCALIGSEIQVCHPRYKVGDKVVVVKVPNGTGVKVNNTNILAYEISPTRFWCAGADDFTPPAS